MDTSESKANPRIAELLRVIGRGARGSRTLDAAQAGLLMQCVLRGELSDAQLGAVVLALRMRGESAEELGAFTAAARDAVPARPRLQRPAVITAAANGARRVPNQLPLLALLLRARSAPLLVLDAAGTDERLHTARLWRALGLPHAADLDAAAALLARGEPVLLRLAAVSAPLAALLRRRDELGVRNFGHAVVKMLVPLTGPSLLLASYTHAEYAALMTDALRGLRQPALLLRGCEGEAAAHPSRADPWTWIDAGGGVRTEPGIAHAPPPLPDALDLEGTVAWTRAVAEGRLPPPSALLQQADAIAACLAADIL